MKRGKRITIFVCFVLFVGCLLWLVFSTRAQFKTLKNNVNNGPPPYQGPEIHRVVVQGELEKIKLNLNQNPNIVSSLDSQRNTLLHLAARYGHTEIVKYLIANRVDINARDEAGYTPLASTIFYCFRYGGIDLNSVKEVVEILIDGGADVNTKTRFGYTPLHHAADWGTKEVVELLISA